MAGVPAEAVPPAWLKFTSKFHLARPRTEWLYFAAREREFIATGKRREELAAKPKPKAPWEREPGNENPVSRPSKVVLHPRDLERAARAAAAKAGGT